MARKKYDVISPDGFSIHFSDTYSSKKAAIKAAEEWRDRYKLQGYYSSVKYGRLPIETMLDYCKIVELKN